jgi:ATP-dependent protease ClpP protease subunit
LIFSLFIEQIYSLQNIILNSTNTITINDQIDETVASDFIYNLNSMNHNKNEIYVYLDTPGGSIESGNKILMEIQKNI